MAKMKCQCTTNFDVPTYYLRCTYLLPTMYLPITYDVPMHVAAKQRIFEQAHGVEKMLKNKSAKSFKRSWAWYFGIKFGR